MKIIAQIKGINELGTKLNKMSKLIPQSIADAINNVADDTVKSISEKTPIGASTQLKGSWHPEYAKSNKLLAKVGTHLTPHYAPDVEYGTRPHFPPIKALREWAQKKLGNAGAAFAVARAISRRGTKAQKPFQKGTVDVGRVLEKEIKIAAEKLEKI